MKRSLVIAADKSGSGKTTLTCGLIYVIKKMGFKVQSFKCGPDYIDPMFHREVLGVPSANIDSFFVSEKMLRKLFAERAGKADVSVIEGVMGYYDGLGGVSVKGSTWEIADIIGSPTVLVMDCKGASVSIAALIRGMLEFPGYIAGKHDSGIRGVILNRVSPMFYERLKGLIEENCPEIRVLGFIPEMKDRKIPSRHLGLIEPKDMEDFTSWIETVSEQIEKTVDVEGILELAATSKYGESADSWISEYGERDLTSESCKSGNDQSCSGEALVVEDKSIAICSLNNREKLNASSDASIKSGTSISDISEYKLKNKVRIGIAEDEAFNFYYQENRELLEKMGAELVSFSPLHDGKLPDVLDGIIIGGGYPELNLEELSANVSMREALASRIKNGIPVIAECGGYMYLNNSIKSEAGLLSDEAVYDDKIKDRFKKVSGMAEASSELQEAGALKSESKTEKRTVSVSGKQFGMCGVFSGDAWKRERLVRFGYVSAETKVPGLFGDAGTVLKGHEFHRYDCEYNGDGFVLKKPKAGNVKNSRISGRKQPVYDGLKKVDDSTSEFHEGSKSSCNMKPDSGEYEGIYYSKTMSCGWPHFYYYSNPKAIFNYMKCCERYHFEKEAQKKWDGIAKPIDSLGVLEKEVIKLCGIQRTLTPSIDKKALVVLCADHGCVKEGVSQTDSSVTRKVADSFAKGATTTAIFAEANNVDVYTVDVGMVGPRYDSGKDIDNTEISEIFERDICRSEKYLTESENINCKKSCIGRLCKNTVNDRRLQDGSGNIAVEAAMSRETGEKALSLGMDIVRELKENGYRIIATGEMGIGNTTPTAALLAYFMGSDAEEAVGYGAGLSEEGLKRKKDMVRRALERLKTESGQKEGESETDTKTEIRTKTEDLIAGASKFGDESLAVSGNIDISCENAISEAEQHADSNRLSDESEEKNKDDVHESKVKSVSAETAKEVLFQVGGLEIAVMAGMFLGGVRYEVPIVIDGIISTAAALSAYMMDERVRDYALASHVSKEKLARKALEKMGLPAIIYAEMSLGEGSGAVLLMPILSSAVEAFNRMGSFSDMEVEAYHRFSH